jgi:hypothetical protein
MDYIEGKGIEKVQTIKKILNNATSGKNREIILQGMCVETKNSCPG